MLHCRAKTLNSLLSRWGSPPDPEDTVFPWGTCHSLCLLRHSPLKIEQDFKDYVCKGGHLKVSNRGYRKYIVCMQGVVYKTVQNQRISKDLIFLNQNQGVMPKLVNLFLTKLINPLPPFYPWNIFLRQCHVKRFSCPFNGQVEYDFTTVFHCNLFLKCHSQFNPVQLTESKEHDGVDGSARVEVEF